MSGVTQTEKNLSLPMLAFFVVVYLTIIQGVSLLLTADKHYAYATFPTVEAIILSLMIPVALSVVFVVMLISWLGWWKRILSERLFLHRWTWIFPVIMVLSIIVVTSYSALSNASPVMILSLLVSVLLVGIGEELMFRGIVLNTMRNVKCITELRAALWTALIFGGAHMSNVFTEGIFVFAQIAIVSVSGIFFYIVLRVSGTILVPILLHAAWDFSLFSGNIGIDPEPSTFAAVASLTNFVLAIIVLVSWRTIWPPDEMQKEQSGAGHD
jgi:membrane protease YdiL (CAAX protease family)